MVMREKVTICVLRGSAPDSVEIDAETYFLSILSRLVALTPINRTRLCNSIRFRQAKAAFLMLSSESEQSAMVFPRLTV